MHAIPHLKRVALSSVADLFICADGGAINAGHRSTKEAMLMFPAIHLSFLEVVFGAQFLGAAVLLTSAVLVDKLYTRLPRRGRLNARFRRSLLRKVMMLRGRDTEAYLRTVSTAGLDCHLEICEGCAHKTQCKTALREEDASYTAFCPNEKMIDGLQQLQPAHSSPLPSHL